MLTIVPTPIGNLRDITLRAIETLKAADAILSEDTRHTQKLLAAHGIDRPLVSFHEHTGAAKLSQIVARLKAGENLALVSDAGTPLVSDPGFELVREARKSGVAVEVLPGPSAVITALVASGLATDAFSFFGFLPQKEAARRRLFQGMAGREETLIFYESPFRVGKVLGEMAEVFGGREAVVARELTKKFEEVARGTLAELAAKFQKKAQGEFVILVSGKDRKRQFL